IEHKCKQLSLSVTKVVKSLSEICPTCYPKLDDCFRAIDQRIQQVLAPSSYDFSPPFTLTLDELGTDSHLLVGGKAFNLATVRKGLGLPVPRGFVVTANSFNYLIEENNLREKIDERLAQLDLNSASSVEKTSEDLVKLIQLARVPKAIEEEISTALKEISGDQVGRLRVSVRSSAVGEDSAASFAGQYESVLNVQPNRIVDAYKEVIASKYSPRALNYRINYGLSDRETPMAVLVLEMIDAGVSGVIYTLDPEETGGGTLAIHSIWGLGKLLVDGSVTPSVIRVTREPPHQLERDKEIFQPVKAVPLKKGGIQVVSGVDDLPANLALDDQSALELMEWATKLEDFQGTPQDIEWCMDNEGKLFILQSRPLHIEDKDQQKIDCSNIEVDSRVLLSGGNSACGGIAAGEVYKVERSKDLESLPQGAVVVAKVPSPDLVKVVGKISAVITDVGSTAGHFASVAREFGIPTLVNTGVAMNSLTSGQEVTVYAEAKIVYEGIVEQLVGSACSVRSLLTDSPFMVSMEKILSDISPLNLVDPLAEAFAPEGCESLHDILRFAHEKSIQQMFLLGDKGSRRAAGAKRLISEIPIIIYLLDLGGGLVEEARTKKEIELNDITNIPLKALWKGLSNPGIYWDPNVRHYDWQEFARISSSDSVVRPESKFLGSYAILSHDYLNFNIHFGFHFVVLDTLCGHELDENYIMLRFAGGGGDLYSKFLRLKFLEGILSHHGFKVEKKGDMIDAQLSRNDRQTLEAKLEVLGQLLGCTRVLDMSLKDGSQVEELIERFMNGIYDFSPLQRR
ncbi:MAG: PEP/pyruvate-binding domain-containing protein, partial [Syntrophobacterales bacterium]